MRDVVVGLGEIGRSVQAVLVTRGHSVSTFDIKENVETIIPERVDVLHICFPSSKKFVKEVNIYKKWYKPLHTVIWSTVPIGTTKKIKGAVHSPVEGRHPNLTKSIEVMTRWVGCNSFADRIYFEKYFADLGMKKVDAVLSSDYTEALKLLSTTEYGLNIVYADYKQKIADAIGMSYGMTKRWNRDYNALYEELGEPQFKKYVLDPPGGKIGGHCVVPNAEVLDKQFPDRITRMIKEYQ